MKKEKSPKQNKIILCVDDEKMVLDALHRILKRHFKNKYDYEFAESGEEAINIIGELGRKGKTVVMVISDQVMPGMTGDQFLTKVHKDYPLPIKIMLTGQSSMEAVITTINEANLYRFISKPWEEEDFLLTIEKGLNEYSLLEVTLEQNELFSRFVPKEFLECLGHESILDIKLGDHVQREMTVLFTDIRNFTTLSETLSIEQVYQFVNGYLSYIESAINKNNGFIDKFIGDAVMILFFNPLDAYNSALDIINSINDFNEAHSKSTNEIIECGIGIHTGMLNLGIIGVESRLQSTVISDAVNVASRIENLTSKTKIPIIASSEFIERLPHSKIENSLRPLGSFSIKGKKQPLILYEIICMENDPNANQKIRTRNILVSGIRQFSKHKFEEAAVNFKNILESYPNDKIASSYYYLSAKHMVEGVSNEWNGSNDFFL